MTWGCLRFCGSGSLLFYVNSLNNRIMNYTRLVLGKDSQKLTSEMKLQFQRLFQSCHLHKLRHTSHALTQLLTRTTNPT